MTPKEFWQNFQLGTEMEIAGNFIYDGLNNLHSATTLSSETETFPILYNLSVGMERLLKVAVVLLEFDDRTDVDQFEESLITHNHLDLLNRIKDKTKAPFGDQHIGFLNLLSTFYKTHRYDRFNLQSIQNLSKDKKALHLFLQKFLQIDIAEDFPFFHVENSVKVKRFIGKTVKKISAILYQIVRDAASSKNLYTYELSSSGSKAAKIFWGETPIVFENEDIAVMEILIFLMQTEESKLVDLMNSIEALPLDPALSQDYLQGLLHRRPEEMQSIISEIETLYEDIEDKKNRFEAINAFKSPNLFLD